MDKSRGELHGTSRVGMALEVISETATSQAIDKLTSDKLNVKFQVTGMSENRIEIIFTD